jgi:hypothetical protein
MAKKKTKKKTGGVANTHKKRIKVATFLISKKKKRKKAKRPNGRPTKYKEVYCQQLIDYFDIEPWDEREIKHFKGGEVTWTDIKLIPVRLPTLRRWAKTINVGISTVYDWINKEHKSFHSKFSDAFIYAKECRKEILIDNGLAGLSPPASFKFVAVNMTDMRDKNETEHKADAELKDLLAVLAKNGRNLSKTKDVG